MKLTPKEEAWLNELLRQIDEEAEEWERTHSQVEVMPEAEADRYADYTHDRNREEREINDERL